MELVSSALIPLRMNIRRSFRTSRMSLLLFVAVVVMFLRSWSARDDLRWRGANGSFVAVSLSEGGVVITRKRRIDQGSYSLTRLPTGFSHASCFPTRPTPTIYGLDALPLPTSRGLGQWAYIVCRTRRSFTGIMWLTGSTVITSGAIHRPMPVPAGTDCWFLRVPLWPLVSLTAVPPVAVIASALRRQRRRANNRCVICGYDLRCSPGRCPECGTRSPEPRRLVGGIPP